MSNLQTRKPALLLLLLMLPSGVTDAKPVLVATSAHRTSEQTFQKRYEDFDMPDEIVHGTSRVPVSPRWTPRTIDTARGADYMSETERQVLIEINMMRTDPARYAQKYLVPLRSYYQGYLIRYPGKIAMTSREGVSALDECIRELQHAKRLSALSPCRGLALAARDHVQDKGRTGSIGHTGSDGSSVVNRMNRYGQWELYAGENISYGYNRARDIVITLLIDDGVPSRGHRKNLLNNSFNVVGIDIGPHREYGNMCVMDFAGGYSPRQ